VRNWREKTDKGNSSTVALLPSSAPLRPNGDELPLSVLGAGDTDKGKPCLVALATKQASKERFSRLAFHPLAEQVGVSLVRLFQ
jgi:hypothetical protein